MNLQNTSDRKQRQILTKYSLSSHKLAIKKGRHEQSWQPNENRPYAVGVQSPEKKMSAVAFSANHRYVQGWSLYQTWHITFTLYRFFFMCLFTSGSGRIIRSNKAAKRATAVWVCGNISKLFNDDQNRYFKPNHDVSTTYLKSPVSTTLLQRAVSSTSLQRPVSTTFWLSPFSTTSLQRPVSTTYWLSPVSFRVSFCYETLCCIMTNELPCTPVCFLCLNLTRPQAQHCYNVRLKIEFKEK